MAVDTFHSGLFYHFRRGHFGVAAEFRTGLRADLKARTIRRTVFVVYTLVCPVKMRASAYDSYGSYLEESGVIYSRAFDFLKLGIANLFGHGKKVLDFLFGVGDGKPGAEAARGRAARVAAKVSFCHGGYFTLTCPSAATTASSTSSSGEPPRGAHSVGAVA